MKLKIHYWILIGFVLGILAGIIFKADEKSILIEFKSGNQIKIPEISTVEIVVKRQETYDTLNANSKYDLINIFKSKYENVHSIFINGYWYRDVAQIKSDESVLKIISPLGSLFLRLLSFLAIPLVIASMIVGVASLGNVKSLGRIGLRTIFFYLVTTSFAVLIGLTIAEVIQPGEKISEQVKSQIEIVDQSIVEEKLKVKGKFDIIDFLINIVPTNPFKAISQGEMLQIIFLAVFFGIGLTFLEEAKRKLIIDFFDGISQVFIRMVKVVLWFAPVGVFALISVAISDFGVSILSTLGY
ncbi:MAG: dicarboxylate/amino acid:cation symporter, partial [Candidatus Kapaibacteriota bacterium]